MEELKTKPDLVNKWTIIALIVGALLGSGSVWSYLQFRINQESQKAELVSNILYLRIGLDNIYDSITYLSGEYNSLMILYSKSKSPESYNKLVRIPARLDILKQDYLALEKRLAIFENREPRSIPLDFYIPEAPQKSSPVN